MSELNQNTIAGMAGNVDVKELVRYVSSIITLALDIKPDDCIIKNYNTITANAAKNITQIFPEIANELNALISKFSEIQGKFIEVQETAKGLDPIERIKKYADSILTIFSVYNIDPGIYGIFGAAQAIEIAKVCGNNAAKFFLAKTLLAGSLPYGLYMILLDYLSLDRKFPINLFNSLVELTSKLSS